MKFGTNFQHRLLNGMHDIPCSTFKLLYYVLGWGAMWYGGQQRPKSRLA